MIKYLNLTLVTCALAACSADRPAPLSIPIGEFSTRFAKAYCATVGPCCLDIPLPYDLDACIDAMSARGDELLSPAPPLREYDPVRAGKCIETLENAWPMCRTTETAHNAAGDACRAIFAGTVAPGGACQSNLDCAESPDGPMRCEPSALEPVPPKPICVLDPPGKSGEPCSGSGPPDPNTPHPHLKCAEGLYCGDTQHCVPQLGEGEDCRSRDALCRPGLWCRSMGPEHGTCEVRLAIGATCTYNGHCKSDLCFENACADGIPPDEMTCNPR